jgi:16S rRNA (guanine966-N2)-methyltransferase
VPRHPQKRPPKTAASRSPEPSDDVAGIRIIGGTLRHRLLEYSGDIRTRPMKDRVREAVFNLIGHAAAGTRAIDLFAGTGALGLEAISRGALSATLIERHYPTSQLIKKNAESLGVLDKCEVIFGDAFLWARKQSSTPPPQLTRSSSQISNFKFQISDSVSAAPWLVFCSPPYEFYISRQQEMLDLVTTLWSSAPVKSMFLVEADERFDFSTLPEPEIWDVRKYFPAWVGLAEKSAE